MSGLPRSPHALVTGGGRGIGREIASALARAGATVTVLGRHRAALEEAVATGLPGAAPGGAQVALALGLLGLGLAALALVALKRAPG